MRERERERERETRMHNMAIESYRVQSCQVCKQACRVQIHFPNEPDTVCIDPERCSVSTQSRIAALQRISLLAVQRTANTSSHRGATKRIQPHIAARMRFSGEQVSAHCPSIILSVTAPATPPPSPLTALQGKYCPYCVQIYREKDPDSFDKKEVSVVSAYCLPTRPPLCSCCRFGDLHAALTGSRAAHACLLVISVTCLPPLLSSRRSWHREPPRRA